MARMRYRNAIITLGFVVLAIGAVDVPVGWKKALCALAGISVVVLGYLAGRDRRPASTAPAPSSAPAIPVTPEAAKSASVEK